MEVLKVLGLTAAALLLATCSLVWPSAFSATLSDEGLTWNLAALNNVGDQLGAADGLQVLGLVSSPGRVWVVTNRGLHGFSSDDLSTQEALDFTTALVAGDDRSFDRATWNASVTDGQGSVSLWTVVPGVGGVGQRVITLALDGGLRPRQPVVTTVASGAAYSVPVGYLGGAQQLRIDPSAPSVQPLVDGQAVGSALPWGTSVLDGLGVSPQGVFAVNTSVGATKLADGHFRLPILELPLANWSSAPTQRQLDLSLGSSFVENPNHGSLYSFHLRQSATQTLALALFGVTTGNNATTNVAVFGADGLQKSAQTINTNLQVVAWGDAWYALGPVDLATGATTYSVPLRKYR